MARLLIGDSAVMRDVRGRAADLATTDYPILITGERGSGKATVARAVHDASGRCDGPVLTLDCAGLDDDALAEELFGRGTAGPCGAGRLASVRGGTLVLREIGVIGPAVQDALLRLLSATPADAPAGARVLATTSHDLARPGEPFPFPTDLLDRLSTHTIAVPPLRERPEDVDDLCRHFAAIAARRERRRAWEPDPATLALFRQYAWPRNVRELRNFVDRAYTVSGGPDNPPRAALIEPWLRAAAIDPVAATVDALAGKPLADIEKQVILSTLHQFRGHRIKTAGALGIGVRTLGIKLKRWRDEGEPVLASERAGE